MAGRASPPEPTRSRRAVGVAGHLSYAAAATSGAELASLRARIAAIESATRAPSALRGRSLSRGREGRGRSGSRRQAALKAAATARPSATPGDGYTVVDRRARRAARRLSRADSAPLAAHSKEAKEATEVTGDHADIEVEPDQPLWVCPACAVEQKFAPKKQCPCCMLQIKVAARAEKPAESAEAVADAVNRYQLAIDALTQAGTNTPNEKAIISAYTAKIALLQKPVPLAPEPPPSERHHAAMVAVEAAR